MKLAGLVWTVAAAILCAGVRAAGADRLPIVVARNATAGERQAARELATYFRRMTGATWQVVPEESAGRIRRAVWVGRTAAARALHLTPEALGPEEWALRSTHTGLVVTGGRPRGTLYAAWHLLGDHFGVRWWTPIEETVPHRSVIRLPNVNRRGRPTIRYRDIYMVEGPGAAAWCARNRLNRNGDSRISPEYGGAMDYYPPYHVHTAYLLIPPEEFFARHPGYFAEIGGKRTHEQAQLCTTNEDVRRLLLDRMRTIIARSREEARKAGAPPPTVFDISQNDWGGFCECAKCRALAAAEGGQSGPYIALVNYLADGIRDQYPDVYIDTLAYFQTQQPPRTLRPRDNVIVRLCDTGSNFARPVTDPRNRAFRDLVVTWARIARHLRIWAYAVTYGPDSVLPFASAQTYAPTYAFYAAHHVEGVFTEHEYGIQGDMRELKLWMEARLLEDPGRSYDTALQDFTDGYYGKAGPMIRRYLKLLQTAQEAAGSVIGMGSSPTAFRHLDLPFVTKAQAIFDRAERAVAGDPDHLRRVRHARLSLDRACLVLARSLAAQSPSRTLPFDGEAVGRRALDTWLTQIDLRVDPNKRADERAAAERAVRGYLTVRVGTPLPDRFRGLPKGSVSDSGAEDFRNWQDQARVVPDPESETGTTARLELSDADTAKYRLPMPWGVYDTLGQRAVCTASIRPQDVPGPGYHWYRLPAAHAATGHYVWFFWSWIIQSDVSLPSTGGPAYEVWARVKFEGPGFPHGTPGQKNAISVERVVVVRPAAAQDKR